MVFSLCSAIHIVLSLIISSIQSYIYYYICISLLVSFAFRAQLRPGPPEFSWARFSRKFWWSSNVPFPFYSRNDVSKKMARIACWLPPASRRLSQSQTSSRIFLSLTHSLSHRPSNQATKPPRVIDHNTQ